jgi:hypothetical protein
MIRMATMKRHMTLLAVMLLIGILAGCAAKKGFNYGSADTGYFLTYRPQVEALTYATDSQQTQNIEIMGQSVETVTSSTSNYTVGFKGMKETNLALGITLNDMTVDVKSMQGDLTPDMSDVLGKSFDMILSPLGKEIDIIGADDIKFDMGQAGKRSIKQGFMTIFPDLGDKPVKMGDTWNSQETIESNEGGVNIKLVFNNVNTLAGMETVEGIECLKIDQTTTGTMEGTGEQMGMDLAFEGDIEGSGTFFFAYKGGYLVKVVSDGFTEATIAASGAQNMTIPMTQENKSETILVK